jgi:hypothetical protein
MSSTQCQRVLTKRIMKKVKPKPDAIPPFRTVEEYEALSEADREKIDHYYSREIPLSETRPLTKAERAQFERVRRRSVGRPKIGKGSKVVAVTLEKGLLSRVDAYAKGHGMKRAELIARGLRMVMGENAA